MLWLDFETYSTADIKVGTYEYARNAQVLLTVFAFDEGPVSVSEGEELTPELLGYLKEGNGPITAHNAQFDRVILEQALGVKTDPKRWRCTSVLARAHGFPGSLEQIGSILGLPEDQTKIKEGKRLIQRFCKPAPKNHKADRYTKHTHPEEWQRFRDYAAGDIIAMRGIAQRLPGWNMTAVEWKLYALDQQINDRGMGIDRALVQTVIELCQKEKTHLLAEFKDATGGLVNSPMQRDLFRNCLNDRFDLDLENTQSATLEGLLTGKADVPGRLCHLISLTKAITKTSTAKYARLLQALSPDNRFRGGLQFCGAARTRRYAGRVFQPQNLPSRDLPDPDQTELFISTAKDRSADLYFDNHMTWASAALRGVIVPAKGKKLVISDLSNIEGRVTAWLAGERWKLVAFREFDQGKGNDLYNVTAGLILGKDPADITKSERAAFGKVPELSLGYGGGVGALLQFADGYGVDFRDYAKTIRALAKRETCERLEYGWENWGQQGGVEKGLWELCETIKLYWRDKHPATVALWKRCEEAFLDALKPKPALKSVFNKVANGGHDYLTVRLPSQRYLTYFHPGEDCKGLNYWGLNGLTRKWEKIRTFGGKIVENMAQSVSRDILMQAMKRADEAGYRTVLSVHDELVCEVPNSPGFSAKGLSDILATNPPWAPGLPLAAAGFEADRYRKG